jgi:hypothetical protein
VIGEVGIGLESEVRMSRTAKRIARDNAIAADKQRKQENADLRRVNAELTRMLAGMREPRRAKITATKAAVTRRGNPKPIQRREQYPVTAVNTPRHGFVRTATAATADIFANAVDA